MTVTTINLDGTPLQAPGVWYSPRLAESSFVDKVSIRLDEAGNAEVRYTLRGDREYTYVVNSEYAHDLFHELQDGESPGQTFSDIKYDSRTYTPVQAPAPAPAQATITITGEAGKVNLIAAHLVAAGFTVN